METTTATTPTTHEGNSFEAKWRKLLKGLSAIRYPLVHNLTSLSTYLTPGEPRYRLLEWLIQRFDPQLIDDSPKNEVTRTMKLTSAASMMGLCSPNDMTMIQGGVRGAAATVKQLDFIQTLVDMVLVTDQLANAQVTQHEQGTMNIRMLERIAVRHSSVFTNSESFPELNIFDHLLSKTNLNNSKPDIASLQKQFADYSTTLNSLCIELNQLSQKTEEEEEAIPSNLKQEVTELSNTCSEFNQAFSSEVSFLSTHILDGDCTNSNLGAQTHRLWTLSITLRRMLEDLSKLKQHFTKANNTQLSSLLQTAEEEGRGIAELQEGITALETNLSSYLL